MVSDADAPDQPGHRPQGYYPDHVGEPRRRVRAGRRQLHRRRRPGRGHHRAAHRGAGARACSPRPTSTRRCGGCSRSGSGSASSTRPSATRTRRSPPTSSTARRTRRWPARRPGSRSCCCRTTTALLPLTARRGRVAVHRPARRHPATRTGTAARCRTRSPPARGLAERLGADRSSSARASTGSRCASTSGYVVAGADPAAPRCGSDGRPDDRRFDLFDWGGGVVRAAGRRPTAGTSRVDDDGVLVNDQPRPERLGGAGDLPAGRPAAAATLVLRHVASGRYVARRTPTASCAPAPTTPDDGDRVRPSSWSSTAAARRPRPRRDGRRGRGGGRQPSADQRPGDRGPRRPGPAAGAGRAAPGGARGQPAHRAGRAAAATRTRSTGRTSTCRRSCGPSHGGQEFGHALADVLLRRRRPRPGG